jgi:LmbE family N-acetylglucosaminyl deacetylase
LEILGAEAVHLTVPDCIYRSHPVSGAHFYASDKSLFGNLDPSETALVDRLADELSGLRRGSADSRLYAPLGLGGHVDHRLTRRAAERAGAVAAYYEDYPYAARVAGMAPEGMVPDRIWLDPDHLGLKIRAMAAYPSQISSFWKDAGEMEAAVRAFAGRTGGGQPAERVWRAR